jgi:2OG-Fe dioxygenase
MSDTSAGFMARRHESVWAALASNGYALTDDDTIGLPKKFRINFHQTYFNDFTLRHDEGDFPVDRKRARDVIRYWWRGARLDLREHDTITITNRAGIEGKRDHRRIELLPDREAEKMVRVFLSLVPPALRQSEGTFGVNLFRTFTDVVSGPHRDYERFVILYILDRVGDGAESYMYRPEDVTHEGQPVGDPVFWQQLNPGQVLILDDERFLHGASPLIPPPGEGTGRRDAVVCTVDYRDTYLGATVESYGQHEHQSSRPPQGATNAKSKPRKQREHQSSQPSPDSMDTRSDSGKPARRP